MSVINILDIFRALSYILRLFFSILNLFLFLFPLHLHPASPSILETSLLLHYKSQSFESKNASTPVCGVGDYIKIRGDL